MWTHVEANWPRYQDTILTRWPVLTHDRLDTIAGDRSALVIHLAEAGDLTQAEAEDEVQTWTELSLTTPRKAMAAA